jgi:hypothetical protein
MTLSSDSSDSSSGTGSDHEELVEEEYIEDEIIEDEEEYVEEEYVEDEIIEEEELIVEGTDLGEAEAQEEPAGNGSAENPINLEETDEEDHQDQEVHDDDEGSEEEDQDVQDEELEDVELEEGDVENQARGAPSNEKFVAQKKPPQSQGWYWICCFFVLGLLGGGGYFGYWLSEDQNKDRDLPILNAPTEDPGPTAAPTVAAVTKFDALLGACDELGETPHPYDQCSCLGEIQIIPDDVAARYNYHLFSFIPTLYNDEWTVTNITDCAPQNQALVWLSSGNDYEFETQEREQRFALATMFASAQGAQWTDNQDWLSSWDSCKWYGVECQGETVSGITLEGNMMKGMVSSHFELQSLDFLKCEISHILLFHHKTSVASGSGNSTKFERLFRYPK